MLCLVWRHLKQQLCSFFKLPGAMEKVIVPRKSLGWAGNLTKYVLQPWLNSHLHQTLNPSFTETPLLRRKKVSQTQLLLLLRIKYEWPWKYHHTLVRVLQGTRARRLSKQNSSSVRHRKPFKFIHLKYFKFRCMQYINLLTSGIKPDVGNPMQAHQRVRLKTSKRSSGKEHRCC